MRAVAHDQMNVYIIWREARLSIPDVMSCLPRGLEVEDSQETRSSPLWLKTTIPSPVNPIQSLTCRRKLAGYECIRV